jgi:glycosyltransferase involved in cell wall biosynthesis
LSSNTLSLCMICKNEEDTIGHLLDSVQGDLFDQIVVCDTGSTDKTLDVLKSYNVQIEHFDWIDDFSAARNFSFSKATGDYIMWLDADDYITPQYYQALLELKKRIHEFSIWLLKYEYAFDEYGNSQASFFRERIVKRSLNLQWNEPIHEYLKIEHPYTMLDIEIHHHKKAKHTERNISILEKIVEQKPQEARNFYYLGKEYCDAQHIEKGIPCLKRFVTMPDAWCENKYEAFIRIADYEKSCSNRKDAQHYLYEAVKEVPLKAKAYYYLGNLALDRSDYEEALHWYNLCVSMKRPAKAIDMVEDQFSTWFPYLQICVVYDRQGLYKEAAIANEKAMRFRPHDPIMQKNKTYFLSRLQEKYPLPQEIV